MVSLAPLLNSAVTLDSTVAVVLIDQRLVILAALAAAFGIVLIVAGYMGIIPNNFGDDQSSTLVNMAIRVGLAFGFGLVAYLVTSWPVAGGFAAVFTLTLKNAKRERNAAIDRVDAIASWVESLRDNLSGSAGLQQALRLSADHAPAPIRQEVRDLVLRLQHESVTKALRRFAADVKHPTADLVVACLLLATNRSAGGLASVLARTAQAARDSATMLRQVEAGRASSQSQAKLVGLLTGGVSLMMVVANRTFVEPYDTFGGQIALFVIGLVYSAAIVLLHRTSRLAPQERVFQGVEGKGLSADLADEAAAQADSHGASDYESPDVTEWGAGVVDNGGWAVEGASS